MPGEVKLLLTSFSPFSPLRSDPLRRYQPSAADTRLVRVWLQETTIDDCPMEFRTDGTYFGVVCHEVAVFIFGGL
jgi:hypothetical protein